MILDIVPANFFTPFTEGNPLQIIFIAVFVGVAMLVFNEKTMDVAKLVEQVNYIVQFIMCCVSYLIPLFVFGSIFSMIIGGKLGILSRSVKIPLLTILGDVIIMGMYLVIVSIRKKVSPVLLMKKLLPTFLIAVTTASSAAAFGTNVETCERKLGIDRKIIDFGIPLGQVIFMPGMAVQLFCMGICLAEFYSMDISLPWIVTLFILAVVISIAAPPVPGGALSCYTILIMQFAIPQEAITIAIAQNIITEFIATAANLFCLQMELIELSESFQLLDKDVLRSNA